MTSFGDSADKTGAAMQLECGTSLAELEYEFTGVNDESGTKKKQENDSENSTSSISAALRIEAIREGICREIVTENSTNGKQQSSTIVATFSSPFEKASTKNLISDQEDKFIKVPLIYCDQTASNRPLVSVENYIQRVCLPFYGNTHTNTSVTGSQSTAFVAEARQIIAEGVNAKITGKASLDVVLFAGNGTTSAVQLLIDCLNIQQDTITSADKRPVVFVGPYEHHSNLLPWRESGCEIVMVPEDPQTQNVDIDKLAQLLKKPKYASSRRLKMGTFTAASNVTGKVCDVDCIAATLHRHGALAFFDYATGAPYLPMDMNPSRSSSNKSVSPPYTAAEMAKDAMFISPHKMIGGINTPGILIVKKNLVNQTSAPSRSGGGTVFYVSHKHHRFLSNRIERYEGGTPNVVGILRAGLTFLVKRRASEQYLKAVKGCCDDDDANNATSSSSIIPKTVLDYEFKIHDHVVETLRQTAPNILMLGNGIDDDGLGQTTTSKQHLPIFSFLIKCGERFLHFNYVCAVLNDLFGIQSRGGCQCSGPYSQRLLGMTKMQNGEEVPSEENERVEHALLHFKERAELLRPGYTRLSLPFKGVQREEVDYVVKALEWVAKNGWALMCQYRCNHRTGEWRHFSRQGKPLGRTERKWLSHFGTSDEDNLGQTKIAQGNLKETLENALKNADIQLGIARTDKQHISQALKMSDENGILGKDNELDQLRWYVYPRECAKFIKDRVETFPETHSSKILGAVHPIGFHGCKIPIVDDGKSETTVKSESSIGNGDSTKVTSQHSNGHESDSVKNDTKPVKSTRRKRDLSPEPNDVVSEKKKPSRDSSAWGKSAETPMDVDPPTTNGETAQDPTKEEKVYMPTNQVTKNRKKKGGIKPPPKMMRYITQAMIQWDMVQEGDRLLLGLSGGKDSLSLLHCLIEFQRKLKINFEIEVCTIDPMTPSFDPSPLIPYVQSLGLKYHYIKDDIVKRANSGGKNGNVVSSLCSYCARMKRGNLYTCARKNNCNKLVLAQHLDDCAESFMMSMMHNGFIRTMKANYCINAGDMSVIRPLVYCRESLMTEFAKAANLPVINENCPACFEEPKERARMKKLLSREETLYPNMYDNIRRALIPIMHDESTAILKSYTEDALAKSRKDQSGQGKKKKGNGDNKDVTESEGTPSAPPVTKKTEEEIMSTTLADASEEELVKALAKCRAEKFKTFGAMKRLDANDDDGDPTGQVCTLDGKNGTIPCRELME